jgi:hypothetical protein
MFQSNNMFSITGTPEVGQDINVDKVIILTINGTTVGTYQFNLVGGPTDCAVVYRKTAGAEDGSEDYYIAHTATIILTEVNTDKRRISGTFSATLVPSDNPLGTEINITNGRFENLNYQLEP